MKVGDSESISNQQQNGDYQRNKKSFEKIRLDQHLISYTLSIKNLNIKNKP